MEINLKGKTAVVTGSRQGIGYGIAVKLAECGANLVLNDIAIEDGDDVAKEARAKGVKVLCFPADVSNEEQVQAMFAAAKKEFGTVDILVNNAGITRDAVCKKMTLQQFNQVIAVNLTGTFLCCREAQKYMAENGGGSIVNFSSVSAVNGNIGQANYAASKAGVIGMSKTLASEFARYGIRVNSVAPGMVDTPMIQTIPEDILQQKIAAIPLKRKGTPEDLANLVLFLASDMSSYITGQVIHCNGGRYMA